MKKEEAQELLRRYNEGTCTPDEKSRMDAWLEQLAHEKQFAWAPEEEAAMAVDLKNAIQQKLGHNHSRIINMRFILAAASVIVVCCLGWFANKYKEQLRDRFDPVVYAEIKVPPGGRMKLTLSDGSTVVLNGSTRLRYPQTFNRQTREVSLLEGEAFFDIHHDDKKMFIVEALGTRTYVLGTAFNIRAYKQSRDIQITVTRGKVSVKSAPALRATKSIVEQRTVTLLPNEQVTIGRVTGMVAQRHINAADYTVWTQGKYLFNNESLDNVAAVLENCFKVHIVFSDDSLKSMRFSSEFENTDKLDDVLFGICKANNLSYTQQGQNILLTAKPIDNK